MDPRPIKSVAAGSPSSFIFSNDPRSPLSPSNPQLSSTTAKPPRVPQTLQNRNSFIIPDKPPLAPALRAEYSFQSDNLSGSTQTPSTPLTASPTSSRRDSINLPYRNPNLDRLLRESHETLTPDDFTKRFSSHSATVSSIGSYFEATTHFSYLPDLLHDTETTAVRGTDGRAPLAHRRLKAFVRECKVPMPGFGRVSRVGVLLPEGPELGVALVTLMAHCCAIPMHGGAMDKEVVLELTHLGADGVVLPLSRKDDPVVQLIKDAGITVMLLKPDATVCGLFSLSLHSAVGQPDLMSVTSKTKSPTRTILSNSGKSVSRQESILSFIMGDAHEYAEHGDTVMILRTSGTSGNKKTVPYSLKTLIVGAKCVAQSWGLEAGVDINLNMMPLYHVGGIVRNLLAPILSGSTVIITSGFDAAAFWDILQHHSPTWYYAVPTMHMAILEEGAQVMQQGHKSGGGMRTSIRMIANAGGGLPHGLAVQLREMFVGSTVLPSYGMTECMPIATPPLDYKLEKPGTSGRSIGPEISIFDENNNALKPGVFGRIMVRGSPVFAGYENDVQANLKAFTTDGFFDTGDMGYLDEDGYLFITGRSKEVINRGGEIISPVEVEDAVLRHPKVLNAIAFSVPHAVLQETIGVVIVSRNPGLRVGLLELQKFIASSLHPTKWPQLLVYMDDLPKNMTNKPLRIKLGERLGISAVDDTTPIPHRLLEAVCPPKGTSLSVPIKNKRVNVANITKVDKSLAGMPYTFGSFVCAIEDGQKLIAFMAGTPALSKEAVVQFLSDKIHEYEIPQDILILPELPKGADGAVDANKCLDMYEAQSKEVLTATEATVLALFTEVLKLSRPPKKMDDFFEIGGNSLTAGKVTALIRGKLGVRLVPMAVFQCRNAVALSEIIEEKQQGEGGKRHHNASSEASLSKYSNEVKSKSPHSMGAMYIQLIPILFLRPLKTAVMWIIFAHLLGFFHFEVFSQFSDRGSVGTSFIILLQLLLSGFTTGVIASIASPIIALLSKWIIIGRYKAGEYPLWGSYYLRWWLVDQMLLLFDGGIFNSSDKTKILYWRLMGAKIAWNFKFDKSLMVREYDLITIESDCVVVDTLMRPFAVDPGLMILKPVTIMQGTTLNLKTSLAPGCIVAPNTVLPPMSSSYESSESSEKYKIFARTGPNPSFLSLLIVGYPIIFCYHLVGLLPWAVAIYWMVQFPFFASGLDIAFTSLTPFGQLLLHFKDLRRIGIHLLALLLNTLLAPFLKLALVVSIKRCVIGKFVAGQKRSSQWEVLRHWIMSELVRKGEFEGVYELLGRHYEGISAIYRALGAKIGKHVYWPGTPMNFYEFDLLEIGDDVVFGSRSKFMFSDAIESRHIKIEDGAMIADRCVVLPGVTVGKSCMIGSGSLLCKNGYYPPGSTWIGSKNGDAVLWDEGNVEAAEREPTLKPFGKAFYHKKATFTVFSQGFIFFYNMMFHAFSTVLWAMPAVVGIVLAGNYYDWIMAKTTEVEVIGHFYFIAGYTLCYYWVMIVSLAIPIAAKRFIMGDLIPGDYDWDKSDYCQRWQISITMQKIASDFINDIRGSAFIVMYFQTLGCTIGERVCLYPNGGDPMLTEPDLVSIGDHTVVDKASIVAHINSKGKFSLNELRIGNNCALRSDSRLLSGAEMCDNSRLLEHTLVLGGDIIESGKVMQGWPANELQ